MGDEADESSRDSLVYPPTDQNLAPLTAKGLARRINQIGLVRLLLVACTLLVVHLALLVPAWPVWNQLGPSVSLSALLISTFSSVFARQRAIRVGVTPALVFIQVVGDQLVITLLVYLSGGLNSAFTPLYGVTCLLAGYLLGVRGAVFSAVVAVVFFSLLALLIETSTLPNSLGGSPFADFGESRAVFLIVSNVLMLIFVALLTSHLFERLSRAGGELAQAARQLEFSKKMAELGRLSSGLAHEIRNPLSSINGALQLLQEVQVGSEEIELCEIILHESSRLEELVTDMLILSRSSAPRKASFDLSLLLKDIVCLAQSRGRGAVDVEVVLSSQKNVQVYGDESQLRQMVWNLLRNAIQSSHSGGQVRTCLSSDTGVVSLSIEDDGAGIPESARERIFDAYFTTRAQGTGIGLAVVKRIVQEHGFKINVQSKAGQGARFLVVFS